MKNDKHKIKEKIKEHQDIRLVPHPDFPKDSFPAALSLFYSLKKLNKNVNLVPEDYPEKFSFLINENFYAQGNFLISIKGNGNKISRIFYQKNKDSLQLYLKTKKGNIRKEDIGLLPLNPSTLTLSLGVNDLEQLNLFAKEKVRSQDIINIDNKKNNKKYGFINFVKPTSYSELSFDLLSSIKSIEDKETVNSLLTGMTEHIFQPQAHFRKETLKKIARLMEKTNFKKISQKLHIFPDKPKIRLFKKSLEKLKINKELNLNSLNLNTKDFQETEANPRVLPWIFKRIVVEMFESKSFICFFKAPNSQRQAFFFSPNTEILENVHTSFDGKRKKNSLIFYPQKSFEEVKDQIKNIIKKHGC